MLPTVEWWASAADGDDGRAAAGCSAAAVCCGHLPPDHQCHVLHAVSCNLHGSLYQVIAILCLAAELSLYLNLA